MKIKTFSPIVISVMVGTAIGFCFSPAAKAPAAKGEGKGVMPEGYRKRRRSAKRKDRRRGRSA